MSWRAYYPAEWEYDFSERGKEMQGHFGSDLGGFEKVECCHRKCNKETAKDDALLYRGEYYCSATCASYEWMARFREQET